MVSFQAHAVSLLFATVTAAISGLIMVSIINALDPSRKRAQRAELRRKELEEKLQRRIPPLDAYEEVIAADIVDSDDIDVSFDSIGGLEDVKDELQDLVVLPLLRPELFHGKLLGLQKGVLLYGPPGTGKTLLAKALAKEANAVFINVRISNLMSKWFGDGQKLVSATFSLANKLQPAIIFVDEVDSFLGSRGRSGEHEALASMKTEFMTQWDGFGTKGSSRVLVLCATNRPWDLDDAILRRTSRSFEIPLPNAAGRASILQKILATEEKHPDLDMEEIAASCEGMSGADLHEVCRQVALIPIKELMVREKLQTTESEGKPQTVFALKKRPLQISDFRTVLTSYKPSQRVAQEYRETVNTSVLYSEILRRLATPGTSA